MRNASIFRTLRAAGSRLLPVAIGVLFTAGCAKHVVIEELPSVDDRGTDPMLFTCRVQQDMGAGTKTSGSQLLTSDFRVSVWKAFATDRQHVVMDDYKVEYGTRGNAWSGTEVPYWDYTTVSGQNEKYWDFSSFPYRFHAVAPYPENPADVVLTDSQLTISKTYRYQSCINALVQPSDAEAEPYKVAQVHRGTDGKDSDLLSRDEKNTNLNNGSTSRNRQVWMPFHHLNSKVRFGVYTLHPWASANRLYIEDLTIGVTSDFATQASGYQASCNVDSGWNASDGFTGKTIVNGASVGPIFRFDGGEDVAGNDLRMTQTQKTAFFLQCKDGIMQIPQEGVQLKVSFKLMDDGGTLYKEFVDVPLEYEIDGTYYPKHTWEPGYLYTYYLIIGGVEDKLELTFTCTLTPWENVHGNLTTDLEQ